MPAATPPAASIRGPEARTSTRGKPGPASCWTASTSTSKRSTAPPGPAVRPWPVRPGRTSSSGKSGTAPARWASALGVATRRRPGQAARTAPVARPSSASEEVVRDQGVPQHVDHVQRLAGAERDRVGGVLGDHHRDARRLAQELVVVPQQRAAAGHDDAAVDHVRDELRRRLLEHAPDAVGDLLYGLLEGLDDVRGRHPHALGQAVDQVAAADLDLELVGLAAHGGGADLALDLLGGAVADEEVLLLPDVAD